jgi:hypothetical protein
MDIVERCSVIEQATYCLGVVVKYGLVQSCISEVISCHQICFSLYQLVKDLNGGASGREMEDGLPAAILLRDIRAGGKQELYDIRPAFKHCVLESRSARLTVNCIHICTVGEKEGDDRSVT